MAEVISDFMLMLYWQKPSGSVTCLGKIPYPLELNFAKSAYVTNTDTGKTENYVFTGAERELLLRYRKVVVYNDVFWIRWQAVTE